MCTRNTLLTFLIHNFRLSAPPLVSLSLRLVLMVLYSTHITRGYGGGVFTRGCGGVFMLRYFPSSLQCSYLILSSRTKRTRVWSVLPIPLIGILSKKSRTSSHQAFQLVGGDCLTWVEWQDLTILAHYLQEEDLQKRLKPYFNPAPKETYGDEYYTQDDWKDFDSAEV